MPESEFADFLASSLDALDQELPRAYAAVCKCLGSRSIRIVVDGELAGLRCDAGHLRLAHSECPAVVVATSKAAILDIIDARCSLLDAISGERFVLTGGPDDMLAFHDALMSYVHGAIRAPSFPALLRAYRSSAPASAPWRGGNGAMVGER